MKKVTSDSLQFRLALLAKAKLNAADWLDYAEENIPLLQKMQATDIIQFIEDRVEDRKKKVIDLVALLNEQLTR